jgi:hypothetical protein
MYQNHARLLLTLSSTVVLVACQDGTTAPRDIGRTNLVSASLSNCGGTQAASEFHSLGDGYPLPGVTVTATFPGGGGLPWNIMQQMQFPLGAGADRAPCLGTPQETYRVDTLYIAQMDTIPAPEGVDPGWWNSLSPREQRAILRLAQLYMQLNPNRYPYAGAVINQVFFQAIQNAKSDTRIRANDFQLPGFEGDMLAGGIYGCELYQRFVRAPDWLLSNDETREFVISMVTAFAEAEYTYAPLRALRFGRNGAIGAGLAQASATFGDCGWLIFNSIPGGSIVVTDPYTDGTVPPTPGGGGGRPPLPPAPEPGALPPGWYDF